MSSRADPLSTYSHVIHAYSVWGLNLVLRAGLDSSAYTHVTSGIECVHRWCPFVYDFVCEWQNNAFIVVVSALSRTPGWAVLKPDKTGGGETEARKADCVEQPNASERIMKAAIPASCQYITHKSCCAICPAVEFHSR